MQGNKNPHSACRCVHDMHKLAAKTPQPYNRPRLSRRVGQASTVESADSLSRQRAIKDAPQASGSLRARRLLEELEWSCFERVLLGQLGREAVERGWWLQAERG